jgi:hypothetical protein
MTVMAFSTIPSGAAVAKAVNNPLSVLGSNLGPMSKGAFEDSGKTGIIEQHHRLPQQFKKQFEKAGLDIEKYKMPLDKADHRLKPNGLHTGTNNWNKQWDDFFEQYPDAKQNQILNQLDKMQ